MPLSSAFNPNRSPNIKDVQYTPEKKHENIFDPERDITEEDFQGMLENLNRWRGTDWQHFSSCAYTLLTLFPERRSELQLDDEAFRGMLNKLNTRNGWFFFIIEVSLFLSLFPERRAQLDLREETFRKMRLELDDFRGDWPAFSSLASSLITIFPKRREDLDLNERAFQGMLKQLNEFRNNNNWKPFSSLASELLTMFPARRDELGLYEEAFQGIMNTLNTYRQSTPPNWLFFSEVAADLKILLADEIKRKEDGTLDIIFNKPKATELKEETPPQPIMRNY